MNQPPQQFQYGTNTSVTLQPKKSLCAILSMVFGLLALPAIILCFTSVPLGITALVLGIIGLAKIRGSAGRVRGSGMAWTGIVTSVIALVGTVAYFSFIRSAAEESAANPVPKSPLEIAESNVRTSSGGVAYGNTPEAKALAGQFSESITELNAAFFTREGRKGLSLSGNKFITHCQLGDGTCAFIIHVPSYRKYTDDAKESLSTLAWQAAQAIAVANPDTVPPGSRIAVGLRGVILYGSITTGTVAASLDADPSSLITTSGENPASLASFFLQPTTPGPEAPGETESQPAADPFGS